MVGGFGEAGSPMELIHALIDQGASDLTLISNNTGNGRIGLAALMLTAGLLGTTAVGRVGSRGPEGGRPSL